MNPYIDFIVMVFMEMARLFVVRIYAELFFQKNRNTFLFYFCSYILTTVVYFSFHNLFFNLMITLIGMFIIMMGYKGSLVKKLLISVLMLAISSVIDMLATFLLSVAPSGDNYDIASSFLSVGLFLLSALISKTIFKKDTIDFFFKEWWFLMLVLIMSIITLFVISNDSIVSRSSVLWIGITLFSIDIIVIKLYEDIINRYKTEKEKDLLHEQMKLYENQQMIRIESEKRISSMNHDMKHHLNEIAALAKNNNGSGIISYISEMTEYITIPNIVRTNNESLDSILNYKISEAVNKKLRVNTNITIPDDIKISSFDMNVIFGNLFDNAIAASNGIKNGFIDLTIKYNLGCLCIKMNNKSRDGIKRDVSGEILSSKPEKHIYGIGLKNVKEIVDKYHGSIEINTKDEIVIVDIILFL